MDFGQDLAVLADQVRFQLDAEGQVAAQAGLGDLAQLVDHLRQVLPRVGALGMIEREAADQLGLEGVGQVAGLLDVLLQVFLERHVGVLRAVVDVEQLDLADRRADRGHVQPVFVLQVADRLDFALAQLHHVLDAVAGVDEPQAVVLQAHRGEGGELLHGRLLVGGLVAETAERDWGGRSCSVMEASPQGWIDRAMEERVGQARRGAIALGPRGPIVEERGERDKGPRANQSARRRVVGKSARPAAIL